MRGLWRWFIERWKWTVPLAVVLGAVGAWLVFGFFGFHTLFIDDVVDEANPFVAQAAPSGLAGDETTQELADAMNDAMEEEGIIGDTEVDEPMEDVMDEEVAITTLASGMFIDRAHPTSGVAKVITDGTQTFLRFEDFVSDNGPDLNVYLGTGEPTGDPGDFIDLGDLKGNIGSQNYELPNDIDLTRYRTVYIWCVRFSVGFGAALLS